MSWWCVWWISNFIENLHQFEFIEYSTAYYYLYYSTVLCILLHQIMIPPKRSIPVLNYENDIFYRMKLPSPKLLGWSDNCLLFTQGTDQTQVSDIPYEDVKRNCIARTSIWHIAVAVGMAWERSRGTRIAVISNTRSWA